MNALNLNMDKVGLDQVPGLYAALSEFCAEIHLDKFGSGSGNWTNELEYRRRDGFIPHSHNHGGFDVYNCLEMISGEDESGDDDELMLHGFRIMYEGQESGTHTVCIYYCQWSENDCYGIHRAPAIAELEIRFRSIPVLIRKLNKFAKEVI